MQNKLLSLICFHPVLDVITKRLEDRKKPTHKDRIKSFVRSNMTSLLNDTNKPVLSRSEMRELIKIRDKRQGYYIINYKLLFIYSYLCRLFFKICLRLWSKTGKRLDNCFVFKDKITFVAFSTSTLYSLRMSNSHGGPE